MAVNIKEIYKILKKEFLNNRSPVSALMGIGKSPFRVLISALLSSRTKDEVTLEACKRLFSAAKNFDDLKKMPLRKIENLIYPVGFYRTKARHLKEIANMLAGKDVPNSREELIKLPGIGRKVANVILNAAFGKHVIAVDTHVHRIMNRIGYVRTKSPLETEKELMKKLPKQYWRSINYIMVSFGQRICLPVKPFCSKCPIRKYCKRVGVKNAR